MSNKPTWQLAEQICEVPAVDEAIRTFVEDNTGDNAIGLVLAVLEHQAATEAAKATSTACVTCNGTGLVDDGEINHYLNGEPYMCGPVKCVKDCPDCTRAAQQPAPVAEKKLSDTIKPILTPEDFGILDPELAKRAINFANAMVHQAALAATAAPVLSDEQILAQWGKCNEPQIIIDFARRVLAAATRSQP